MSVLRYIDAPHCIALPRKVLAQSADRAADLQDGTVRDAGNAASVTSYFDRS
jgi:hypothetical protein